MKAKQAGNTSLPNNDKFIKVVYEGDTRARELGYSFDGEHLYK